MIKITFSWVPSFEKSPIYTNYLEVGVYKDNKCLYLLTDDGQMIRYYLEDVKKIEKQVKDLTTEEWKKLGFYQVSVLITNDKLEIYTENNERFVFNLDDYIDITALVKGE